MEEGLSFTISYGTKSDKVSTHLWSHFEDYLDHIKPESGVDYTLFHLTWNLWFGSWTHIWHKMTVCMALEGAIQLQSNI